MATIEPNWNKVMKNEFEKPYFKDIKKFILNEKKKGKIIYPKSDEIFNAFNSTPFDNVKVVIIGQDPYHGEGQAHGLSFSVSKSIKPPPSLANIYKELAKDIEGFKAPNHGNLEQWANQGVLLLNAILTVNANEAGSHRKAGWEYFTNAVINTISQQKENVVFLLWGKFAQEKELLIDKSKHLVLKAAHPSPFSAYNGFFGCKHFSATNDYLKSKKIEPINWQI
jgi:uracil-DNA glycosylase